MIDEKNRIDGDLTVTEDTRLYGLVTGSATVESGKTLIVHGGIGRDLILEGGATAHVYGTVFGDVVNRGAELRLWKTGRIRGVLQRRPEVKVEPGATVRALLADARVSEPVQTAEELSGFCVLVAEDDDDTRDEVCALLRAHGADVLAARTGEEAYQVFVRDRPDAIVTDLWMPTDGYEFVKRVRKLAIEQGGLTPAISMTASTSDTQKRALLSGFHGHVQKPFDPWTLTDLLRSFREASLEAELDEPPTRWTVSKRKDGTLVVTLADHVRAADLRQCAALLAIHLGEAPARLVLDARKVTGFDVAAGNVAERVLWPVRKRLDHVAVLAAAEAIHLFVVATCMKLGISWSAADELPAESEAGRRGRAEKPSAGQLPTAAPSRPSEGTSEPN
ncbi:MAG TPA: response regulator [Polyangiaceae bacterium]|jgi:CheY-like chemotaxis protein